MEFMDTATDEGRVIVDRRSLADLIDLAQRAASTLAFADMALSDALRASVTQIQIDLMLPA